MRRIAAGATPIAALALAGGAIAAHGGGTPAVSPGYMAPAPAHTCFWGDPQINPGPIDQLHQQNNWAAPSTDTTYYYSRDQIPAGATLTLSGEFPHARFMDFNSYETINGVSGFPATSLIDDQIRPDPGSTNPFRPGAIRDGNKRAFTITISAQPQPAQPAQPAPNTLYGGVAGSGGQVEVIERIYRPDRGYNGAGGVPLLTPKVTLADGTSYTGQAACDELQVVSGGAQLGRTVLAKEGLAPAVYQSLRDSEPAPFPATDPVHWYRFFNPTRLLEPFLAGTPNAGQISSLPSTITGGYYSTANNAYLYGYVDRTIGPNHSGHNILVLHAKMPTHPDTYDRETTFDSAGTQVRFWSLCNYGSYANPPLLDANSACLFDERVPTDAAGYYTIVVSLPQDRPKNATDKCGVAWMDWGTAGDGQGRATLDNLVIRNQDPSPTFARAIQKITTPDTERQVLGPYYPITKYMTKQQFQTRGCSNSNR